MSSTSASEEWAVISDSEGLYEVSSFGRVRSHSAKGSGQLRRREPLMLKLAEGSAGYLQVTIRRDGRLRSCAVHRLVAEAFMAGGSESPVVRHLDGNKLNNRASNLAWGTHAENLADSFRHGTHGVGEKSGNAKLTEADVREAHQASRLGESFESIGRRLGVTGNCVAMAVKGQTWSHVRPDDYEGAFAEE